MQCKACKHPDRVSIDQQIVNGMSLRSLSTAFGISLGSLHRHKQQHVKQALADAIRASEGERAEHGCALLDRVEKLVTAAEEILQAAKAKNDFRGANGALGAAAKLLDLCGRLSGELQSANAGGIHLTLNRTTHNTIINDNDVEFAQLISEGTKGFDPIEIRRLQTLVESSTTAIVQP